MKIAYSAAAFTALVLSALPVSAQRVTKSWPKRGDWTVFIFDYGGKNCTAEDDSALSNGFPMMVQYWRGTDIGSTFMFELPDANDDSKASAPMVLSQRLRTSGRVETGLRLRMRVTADLMPAEATQAADTLFRSSAHFVINGEPVETRMQFPSATIKDFETCLNEVSMASGNISMVYDLLKGTEHKP